ncbi:hypothetical protein JTB14_001548 [Gonioctena quinquepunctata]|nr:hypothetical protein JTB14_001548 [Gonioctena quinquepunctata]
MKCLFSTILRAQFSKFYEIEELCEDPESSIDDEPYCKKHFVDATKRDETESCIDAAEKVHISLLLAESRVAPLRTLTVLSSVITAALVLSGLNKLVRLSMNLKFDSVYL